MSDEIDTKKLLNYRQTIENRINELNIEIRDLTKAIEVIDKQIVNQGFRTPTLTETVKASSYIKPQPEVEEIITEGTSITAKDGTVLGRMNIEGNKILFKPHKSFNFTIDLPPFKSFLIDRVLANIKANDEEKATKGEIELGEILKYDIKTEGKEITEIIIENYGGERRLREINSSLRWTFDKMLEQKSPV